MAWYRSRNVEGFVAPSPASKDNLDAGNPLQIGIPVIWGSTWLSWMLSDFLSASCAAPVILLSRRRSDFFRFPTILGRSVMSNRVSGWRPMISLAKFSIER